MPTILKKKKQRRDDHKRKERMKIYNPAKWRKLRAWKVINDPLCERCLENGINTPVGDIHHIVSFMKYDDPTRREFLAYDYGNLMSLCDKCHQKEHNSQI